MLTAAQRQRLQEAGFVYVQGGWFRPGFAERIEQQREAYADEVHRTATTSRKRGRPMFRDDD